MPYYFDYAASLKRKKEAEHVRHYVYFRIGPNGKAHFYGATYDYDKAVKWAKECHGFISKMPWVH